MPFITSITLTFPEFVGASIYSKKFYCRLRKNIFVSIIFSFKAFDQDGV